MKQKAIYFDLDGVLADYAGGFAIRHPEFKLDPSLNRSSHLLPGSGSERKRAAYELIKGTDFYADLPIMPDAEEMFALALDADPIILTAAPKFGATEEDFHVNPYWLGAAFHKRNWVEQTFLPSVYERLGLIEDGFIGGFVPTPPLHEDGEPDSWSNIGHRARRRGHAPIADARFICTTSSRKWQFMHRKKSEHQVLIDDRTDNIEAWREAGGIGILHISVQDSIEQLKAL